MRVGLPDDPRELPRVEGSIPLPPEGSGGYAYHVEFVWFRI
jgi:hypothetical protein